MKRWLVLVLALAAAPAPALDLQGHRGAPVARREGAGGQAAGALLSREHPLVRPRDRQAHRVMMRALVAMLALVAAPALGLDLQGHRGARGLLPENTLASFQRALEVGVTTLELDIAITKDGVLAVYHDRTLNPDITRDAAGRFIDAPGPAIHTLTWAQLQTYDVGRIKPGTNYARNFADQQPMDGTRIPRLSDLFDLVKRSGDERVRFAIETKLHPEKPEDTLAPEPFARAVVDEIRKAGMAARSQILSFDWRTLQVVQKIAPVIQTV